MKNYDKTFKESLKKSIVLEESIPIPGTNIDIKKTKVSSQTTTTNKKSAEFDDGKSSKENFHTKKTTKNYDKN